jgi:ankyrin repeat protein
VECGASVTVSNTGVTPLHLAARENNNPEILQSLLRHGASVEAVYGFGITSLHEAAIWSKNPKIIETLLTNHAPIRGSG